MAAATKIVFLGASSASFGLSMFRDLFSTHDLAGSTLVLVGRNAERLARTERLARLLNEKSGAPIQEVAPIQGMERIQSNAGRVQEDFRDRHRD